VIVDAQGEISSAPEPTLRWRKACRSSCLEHAGEKARGATLYIISSRVPIAAPYASVRGCVIARGIQRVVASMDDPNPQVSEPGFENSGRRAFK